MEVTMLSEFSSSQSEELKWIWMQKILQKNQAETSLKIKSSLIQGFDRDLKWSSSREI